MTDAATDTTIVVRKVLTANDLGRTGSHQAGLHVPKALTGYLPPLDEGAGNPDCWLDVEHGIDRWRWRYTHFNNRLTGLGTRDEYRLTHVTAFLRTVDPRPGDTLEMVRLGPARYRVAIGADSRRGDELVLISTGPWKVVRLARAS